jgi:CTP:molybdopterin cytidylyltransferase MocA
MPAPQLPPVAGLVLAAGASVRMGEDKLFVELGG